MTESLYHVFGELMSFLQGSLRVEPCTQTRMRMLGESLQSVIEGDDSRVKVEIFAGVRGVCPRGSNIQID
ncbi:MAG: hypothetical protein HW380_3570 [Magnetococcales bacterium]|nr:hypothetical protein [Magnetococcales bacterium]